MAVPPMRQMRAALRISQFVPVANPRRANRELAAELLCMTDMLQP